MSTSMREETKQDEEGGGQPETSRGNPNQTLVIQHEVTPTAKNTSRVGGASALLGFLATPTGMGFAFVSLAMTGAFAYFFSQWFRIPGLEDQVEELEVQVDRLTVEVDRLGVENKRFEELNSQLNMSVTVLEMQNAMLNMSVTRFEMENMRLNASNQALRMLNAELAMENAKFAEENRMLNESVMMLDMEVAMLNASVENLTIQINMLDMEIDELNNETEQLSEENMMLNMTVIELNDQVDNLTAQVQDLQEYNDNLLTIIGFLNATSENFTSTEELAEYLAEAIDTNRNLLIERVEADYRLIATNWDCAYYVEFADQPFVMNLSTPIGADSYGEVMDYVDFRLLFPMCLNQTDLEVFLNVNYVMGSIFPPVEITSNQLTTGTTVYSNLAFDYYFPDENETGLTPVDWEEANYDCRNLPASKMFMVF